VESVGNESERVSQKSVEELDEGERQVDAQKPQQVPGIAIRQNQPDPTNKSNKYIIEINYVKIAFREPPDQLCLVFSQT
jgi:hypothetical protein